MSINETHDPALRSWVESANDPDTDFPIQNLPVAVFRPAGSATAWRGGFAIGDQILDMAALAAAGVFDGELAASVALAARDRLNDFMALTPAALSALRLALSRGLRSGATARPALNACLVPQARAQFRVPADIGDYTDMYASIHHATNIGRLFRPDNPLMPNFRWLPVGYHGRVSSIDVSGQSFPRPNGQRLPPGATEPVFGPSQRMDYELEMGIWVGRGNAQGEPIAIDSVDDHLFGLCLLNDWSSRDIQAWEYQPLGPFLSKNFATTISPWIVMLEALEPFRVPWTRPQDHPQPLPYLESADNRARGGFDIRIESGLLTAAMAAAGQAYHRLSLSTFSHSYWSVGQMVAHHTVGGCNLRPGDLIGSGTQSGPTGNEAAALIEITRGGREPVTLPDGESRTFLDDGDTVILRGWCVEQGYRRIGFGECRGTLLPSRTIT